MFPTSMFLISSSPSAARLSSNTAVAVATTYAMPITASCGTSLSRFPVNEKIAAPISVNPSAIAKVAGPSRSMCSSTAMQIPSEAICAIAMSMKMMPRCTTWMPR